jgi:hypothetical protein
MMEDAKSLTLESFGMEVLIVLKYLGIMVKDTIDKLVQVIFLIHDGIRSWYQLEETDSMSSLPFSTGILGEVYLNGSKTMKMPLQNFFFLDRRHGMMMIVRHVNLFRTLVWLTQYLKN